MMWQAMVKEAEQKMKKTVDVTNHDLSVIRTGRANISILDNLKVSYYGAPTLLKQLATLTAPEPRMMIIQPFDITSIKEIEKAVNTSDMGLVPMIDGKVIRITIPALSKERREELAKVVKKVAEDGRISIRAIRRDANENVKKIEKDKKITEDDGFQAHEQIQKLTDKHIKNVDDSASSKEKDLLS